MVKLINKSKIRRGRPTIGITGPDEGGTTAWIFTALWVFVAGGWPIRITPAKPKAADGLQGLIIGGGADINPSTYEKDNVIDKYLQKTLRQPKKNIFRRLGKFFKLLYYPILFFIRKFFSRKLKFALDHARDHLELQLIDQAVKKGLPVMGICRGSQLLNVYFGGTLHKNIESFYTEEPNPISIFPVKKVFIKEGSKLEQVLQKQHLRVNALHNQAVDISGANIEIVGTELNKVVQAIECRDQKFMIGVQWHPEYLGHDQIHRRLFKGLVQYAREVKFIIEQKDLKGALARPRIELHRSKK
jgi:putative glutamine amidotransferase